jgi:hypothetical protein
MSRTYCKPTIVKSKKHARGFLVDENGNVVANCHKEDAQMMGAQILSESATIGLIKKIDGKIKEGKAERIREEKAFAACANVDSTDMRALAWGVEASRIYMSKPHLHSPARDAHFKTMLDRALGWEK